MKNAIIKKIHSIFTYTELTEDIIREEDSQKHIKQAKMMKKFISYSFTGFIGLGLFNDISYILNGIFDFSISDLSVLFFYFFNPVFLLLIIGGIFAHVFLKKMLKEEPESWEKESFLNNLDYKENSGFLKTIKFICQVIPESSLLKEVGKKDLSLALYKKLAEKLSKEEMLIIAEEKLAYSDLNIDSVYLGDNPKMQNLFVEDSFNHERQEILNDKIEYKEERSISEKFVDSLYIEK